MTIIKVGDIIRTTEGSSWIICKYPYPCKENDEKPIHWSESGKVLQIVYTDDHETCPFVIGIDEENRFWGSYFTGKEGKFYSKYVSFIEDIEKSGQNRPSQIQIKSVSRKGLA